MTTPLVSIIIPAYNCEAWIEECLESVLAQTYSNWECIVVDDGSTDGTWTTMQEYARRDGRIQCHHQENQGPAVARNNAVAHSRGEYILPVDADDRIALTCIERMVTHFQAHPETNLVCGKVEFFGLAHGIWDLPEFRYEDFIWGAFNIIICSAMYRRSDFDRVGGYNPKMRDGLEDTDFWLSLLSPTSVVYRIDEVLYYYRQTGTSRTTNAERNIAAVNRQLYHNHPEIYQTYVENIITLRNNLVGQVKYYQQQLYNTQQSRAYRIGKWITRLIPSRIKKVPFIRH